MPQMPPLFVSTFSKYCRYNCVAPDGQTLGTQSGTANLILYYPIVIPWFYPIRRFWVYNSSIAGNVDIGLYSRDGARLVSTGSTVHAGTPIQYISASYLASPGSYYLAIDFSSGSAATQLISDSQLIKYSGMLQQSGVFPLPAAMTPEVTTNQLLRMFGFTLTESGF